MSQIVGAVLAAVGVWLLWSPWALLIAGLLLIIAPEFGVIARRRRGEQ